MWTYTDAQWPPVIRLPVGCMLDVELRNSLERPDEHTSIHWHGMRLPNDQDGVPYLVQAPVRPGESFRYRFAPPDAGTFFFHSHCNSAEQMGRGLQGVLVVDGDTTEPYDTDVVLLLRDWRVQPGAKAFDPFTSPRYAARAGTYGETRSANGASNPLIALPASGDCRIRLLNTDPTRIMHLRLDGAEAAVVAIDGIAVTPFAFAGWLFSPAKRCDIVMRAPGEGALARLVDISGDAPVELARFTGTGAPRRARAFDPAPLRASLIAPLDLGNAKPLLLRFNSTDPAQTFDPRADIGAAVLGDLCLSTRTFWTINDEPWPQRRGSRLPPPIAQLQRGATYLLKLRNESEFAHPIHLHGHTLTVLRSSKQDLPVHHADTVLLLPGEEADAAFVADNPGNWMLHCHVIEHQENGMMAFFRVA
jgi:FtsP/CotA-like multicopper oxidase with cupredoxin domain